MIYSQLSHYTDKYNARQLISLFRRWATFCCCTNILHVLVEGCLEGIIFDLDIGICHCFGNDATDKVGIIFTFCCQNFFQAFFVFLPVRSFFFLLSYFNNIVGTSTFLTSRINNDIWNTIYIKLRCCFLDTSWNSCCSRVKFDFSTLFFGASICRIFLGNLCKVSAFSFYTCKNFIRFFFWIHFDHICSDFWCIAFKGFFISFVCQLFWNSLVHCIL